MGRRGRLGAASSLGLPGTAAREALELRWRERMDRATELAGLVTSRSAAEEPRHRWIHLAQGFSPELVRSFLRKTSSRRLGPLKGPILDPFSGSGTVVIECTRQAVHAIGVEAAEPLVFLSSAAMTTTESELRPLPALDDGEDWEPIADRLETTLHRAALMLAVARQHTSAGKLNRKALPILPILHQVISMMRDDLRRRLPLQNLALQGDARRMDMIKDGGVAAILTSPPYLSRHDYAQILRPYELVYRRWYPQRELHSAEAGTIQVRAHPAAIGRSREQGTRHGESPINLATGNSLDCAQGAHEAAAEAGAALRAMGEARLASVISAYFDDLRRLLTECARVLRPGGACWIVIGGARLKGVYVPSDLIAADLAKSCGFRVEGIRVARHLIDVGRKLGRLRNVTPRESILILTKV